MKVIKYEGRISAKGYLEYLESIKNKLPESAYEFASDSQHYDFNGDYCTHDLDFKKIEIANGETIAYELYLQGNKFKHLKDLKISYLGVSKIKIARESDDLFERVHDLIIDEVSWDEDTEMIIHELQFIGMSLIVFCKDLKGKWVESEYLESMK